MLQTPNGLSSQNAVRVTMVMLFGFLALVLPSLVGAADWKGKPLSHWIERLDHKDFLVQNNAAWVLEQMGPTAIDSAPALAAMLRDATLPRFRNRAGVEYWAPLEKRARRALLSLGDGAVPLLQEMLGSDDCRTQCAGVVGLGAFDSKAMPALKTLTTLLESEPNPNDPYESLHREAANTLSGIGPEGISALVGLLDHPNSRVPALHGLGNAGPRAGAAVETIVPYLRGTDRRAAVNALGRIGPAAEPAVPLLIEMLIERDATTQNSIVRALAKIGAPAVPGLAQLVVQTNTLPAQDAADALNQIGPDAQAALPALMRAVQTEKNEWVRKTMIEAMMQMDVNADEMISFLDSISQSRGAIFQFREKLNEELNPAWW